MKKTIFIGLLTLLCLGTVSFARNCTHDEMFYEFKPEKITISDAEKLIQEDQKKTVGPIRIFLDYSNLFTNNPKESQFIQDIMNSAVDFLQKRINVEQSSFPLRLRNNKCFEASIPLSHVTPGISSADLVIYVTSDNEPKEQNMAWATFCAQDALNGRPIAGQLHWNSFHFRYDPIKFHSFVDIAVHELTHILVFDKNLYQEFRMSFGSKEVRQLSSVIKTVTVDYRPKFSIITPKIVQAARHYFNCSTLEGVELEDRDDFEISSSHWERRTLHNEIMGASSLPDESFSVFTMALLEDSGWYQVHYKYAEPLYFGKHAGCQFLQGKCSPTSGRTEWCKVGQKNACTYSLKGYGPCLADNFANQCAFVTAYDNSYCEVPRLESSVSGQYYGPGSRCVIGNIIESKFPVGNDEPGCYKYTCEKDNKSIRFHLQGGGEVICRSPGRRVTPKAPYKGSIICPDPKNYCSPMFASCRNDCSRKGNCNNGVCECIAGWEGEDCSVKGGNPASGGIDGTSSSNSSGTSSTNQSATNSSTTIGDKSLLVINCPKKNDPYYGKFFDIIVNFVVNIAQAVNGNDNIIVLADKATASIIEPRLPPNVLYIANVEDIWLRDFSYILPWDPVILTYKPNYLPASQATSLQDSLKKIMKDQKMNYKELKKKINLDGGNVVDNGKDQAIVTERMLEDNPNMTREEIAQIFAQEMGIKTLTIIPYDKLDKTAHSDGMVSFLDEKTLLINDFIEDPGFSQVLYDSVSSQVKKGTKIVRVPTRISNEVYDGFSSAGGLYVNCVPTNHFVYVPTFGDPQLDGPAIKIIEDTLAGSKKVIPIDAREVCKLGGSVRCVTWQLQGRNAQNFLDAIKRQQ